MENICKNCETKLWSWTCVYKDEAHTINCLAEQKEHCGDLVVECEKYSCSLKSICRRAYLMGKRHGVYVNFEATASP